MRYALARPEPSSPVGRTILVALRSASEPQTVEHLAWTTGTRDVERVRRAIERLRWDGHIEVER